MQNSISNVNFCVQEVLPGQDTGVLRGYRVKEGELPTALHGFLYSCLRSTKAQRRAILMNFLKQFDDMVDTSLSNMLYLADNLAYIPYTVIDEPLFLIHHVDVMVSVIGTNVLQSIKESLKLPPEYELKMNPETGREEVSRVLNIRGFFFFADSYVICVLLIVTKTISDPLF